MNWVTPEEVRAYATTPKKALEISIKAWWQKRTATEKEIREEWINYGESMVQSPRCGLCVYYRFKKDGGWSSSCGECPVIPRCGKKKTLWSRARIILIDFVERNGSFAAWQEAAANMHKGLCALRKK